MELDPVIFMQVEIFNLYRSRHNLSIDEFFDLDEKFDLFEFIEEGYEPFHLMGNEGILIEVDEYIKDAQSGAN